MNFKIINWLLKNLITEYVYPFVMDTFHVIREYSKISNHKNKKEHDELLEKARKYFYKGEYNRLGAQPLILIF